MNQKDKNIAVFQDTMQWIDEQEALSDAVRSSIAHTILYPAQQLPELPEVNKNSKA